MKCKIDGCDRDAMYTQALLCQKHYFRIMRNGHPELLRDLKQRDLGYSRVYRVTMPGKGYQRLYEPGHPLCDKSGTVSEHRKVVFDRYGYDLPDCEICGKPTDWVTCHIDHIDRDVKNNSQDNLRPLCRQCNVWRDYPPQHTLPGAHSLTYNGITKTPQEWAREPWVNVSGSAIRHRMRRGMSDYDCLFAPKITHNGNSKAEYILKLKQLKDAA